MKKWLVRILLGIVVIVGVGITGLYTTGYGRMVPLVSGVVFGAPSGSFDPKDTVSAPDYSQQKNWAALPDMEDLADLSPATEIPETTIDDALLGRVDVFFIHPTGYLTGDTWTSQMNANSKTGQNTQWMMSNQASSYNGCCEVYAPRYRQANIFTYISHENKSAQREAILSFAYGDVERAFEYYLQHYNKGKPFIIASHSQGTHHGRILLQEKIEGTELADRMVAAFLIGGNLARSEFDGMQIGVCQSATDLGCVVHWDTMSEQADPEPARANTICVNPLSWQEDGELVSKSHHLGGVVATGKFQVDFFDDSPTDVEFTDLGDPIPNHVDAQCADGVLKVTHQDGTVFSTGMGLPGGTNYHGLDYPLFYMDVRANAIARVRAFLKHGA